MTHVRAVPGDRIQVPFRVALQTALVAVSLPTKGLVVLPCEFVEGLRPAPLHIIDLVDGVGQLHRLQGDEEPEVAVGAHAVRGYGVIHPFGEGQVGAALFLARFS